MVVRFIYLIWRQQDETKCRTFDHDHRNDHHHSSGSLRFNNRRCFKVEQYISEIMTYPTNKQNTFKKDYLRGLEVNQPKVKPVPVVQITFACLILMALAVCVKMCCDKRNPEIALFELNADRR